MEEPQRVEITLKTELGSVDLGERLAVQIATAAGFDEDNQYAIGLAVRECLVNAATHGNHWDPRKRLGLSFAIYSDRLTVEISDQGPGFDPKTVPNPLVDDGLMKPSGRGLLLARCFTDELQVSRRPEGGALVTITKWHGQYNAAAQSVATAAPVAALPR